MSKRSQPLLRFVLLTFGIAWGLGVCLVVFPAQMAAVVGAPSLSSPLVMLAVYAPSISALVLTALASGPGGIRRLLGKLLQWRVGVRWYAAVLLGIPALSALARLLHGAAGGPLPPIAHWYDLFLLGPSGQDVVHLVRASHGGPLAVAQALLTVFLFRDPGPLGEELGWRGYALPLLLRQRSPLRAGLALANAEVPA